MRDAKQLHKQLDDYLDVRCPKFPAVESSVATYDTNFFEVPARDFYADFLRWCADTGIVAPMSLAQMGRLMSQLRTSLRRINGTSYFLSPLTPRFRDQA